MQVPELPPQVGQESKSLTGFPYHGNLAIQGRHPDSYKHCINAALVQATISTQKDSISVLADLLVLGVQGKTLSIFGYENFGNVFQQTQKTWILLRNPPHGI